jgi:hypothetical protein
MWDELYYELSNYFQRGKKRLMAHQQRKKPLVKASQTLESFKDFTLICQEDIFHPKSRRKPVLLLSKGQEISTRDLPKLILHGVQPEQFRFKADEADEAAMEEAQVAGVLASTLENSKVPDGLEDAGSNSLTWRPLGKRRTQTVVILESNPKILKRLIDCLFVCGFDLNKIHPVGVAANLGWSLKRYKPDLLIGSAPLLTEALNTETLKLLPTQLIMTLADTAGTQSLTQVTLANGTVAHCLYKPITRFSLRQLLLNLEPEEVRPTEVASKPKSKIKLSRRAMLKMG